MDRLACMISLIESASTARTHNVPGRHARVFQLATPGKEDIAMPSNLIEITGAEALAGDGGPLDALIDFYRSFNARDLDGLTANWADGDAPSMDGPLGGVRRGWLAIREGYSKLFNGPATVRVGFPDFTTQGGGGGRGRFVGARGGG